MTFWIAAAVLAAVVGGLLARALFREGGGTAEPSDIQVYRDQLQEVDRDLARGVLTPDEAERVRVEVSRRLLEADRLHAAERGVGAAPRGATLAAAATAAVAVGGALALYGWLGAPGYPDLPLAARIEAADAARAGRPDQAAAEAQMAGELPAPETADPSYIDLVGKLRAAMAERPDDLQGWRLLAQNEARLGNYAAAHAAQARLIEILGDAATAADYADLADLMILAAGGYVSPQAEAAVNEALRRDPQNGPARYFSGLLYAQTGRPDLALRIWRALLQDSRPGAPWVPPVDAQIRDVARLAGVRYAPPERAQTRGPSAADVQAASQLSPEERMEMIRGMVAGLSDRLATDGGPPEDWARLIGAYGVLGETERARAIWTEAQTVFADTPDGLAAIRAAAERAGVAE